MARSDIKDHSSSPGIKPLLDEARLLLLILTSRQQSGAAFWKSDNSIQSGKHACPGAAVRFLNVAKTPSCCQKTRKTWATLFVPTLKPHFGFQWTVFNECPYSLFSFYGQLSYVLLSVLLFSQEAERLKLFLMDGSDDSAWSSLWSPDTQSSVSWLTVTSRPITTDRNNFMSHLFK